MTSFGYCYHNRNCTGMKKHKPRYDWSKKKKRRMGWKA